MECYIFLQKYSLFFYLSTGLKHDNINDIRPPRIDEKDVHAHFY